ncbi:Reverse transcriptase (RNA-dependent DNA polymerase), partial [Rhizoctonia solani]
MPTADTGQSLSFSQNSEISISSTPADSSGPQRSASSSRMVRMDPISQKNRNSSTPRRHSSSYPEFSVPSSQPGESWFGESMPTSPAGSVGQHTPKAALADLPTAQTSPKPVFLSQVSQSSSISQFPSSYTTPTSTQASSISNASLGSEGIRAAEEIEDHDFASARSFHDRPGSACTSQSYNSDHLPTERPFSQPDSFSHPSDVFKRVLTESVETWDSVLPEGERIEAILETFSTGLLEVSHTLRKPSWDTPLAARLLSGLRNTFAQFEAECQEHERDVPNHTSQPSSNPFNWLAGGGFGNFDSYTPSFYPPPMQTDYSQILAELQRFKHSVNGRLAQIENQLVDKPRQDRTNTHNPSAQRPPIANSNSAQPPAPQQAPKPQTSFASVVTQGGRQPNETTPVAATPAPGTQPKGKNKGKSDPIRFTIPVGDAVPVDKRLPEFEIYSKVRNIVDQRSNSIGGKLMEVKWNAQGNLMLSFAHTANVNAIQAISGEIRTALRLDGAGELRRAVPWSKVSLSGVASGIYSGDRTPHSKEALLYELLYSNSFLKNYVITQGPDWTAHPSKISTAYASISFAFEDKDGSGIINHSSKNAIAAFHTTITPTPAPKSTAAAGVVTLTPQKGTRTIAQSASRMAGYAPLGRIIVLPLPLPSLARPSNLCNMSDKLIHVLQLNVAGSPARVHAILNDKAYDYFDILLIQDPWWGKIGSEKSVLRTDEPVYGTTHSPRWHCYHPPIGHSLNGPGVVTYVRKGVQGLSSRFSDKIPMSRNLIPIDFMYFELPFSISNIYLHGNTANETLIGLLDAPADASEAHIYCGDFNLHHPLWALSSNPHTAGSASSDMLAEWLLANRLEILNSLDVPTRVGRRGQRDSIIDLTIANDAVIEGGLVSKWECSGRGSLGSDHNCITWTITINPPCDTRNSEGAYRHRIDIAGEDDWIKAATIYLEEHPPPQYTSTQEIEEGALIILKAMSTATELSMEKVLVNKAKPRLVWWNNQCSRAVTELEDCDNPEDRSAALGRLQSAIRGAKRSRGDNLCTKVTNPEAVFKFTNWYKGKREAPLPPLIANGLKATLPEDQARLLRDAFFPATAPPADSSSPLGIPLHPTRPHHGITVDKISRALNSASNTSAPGAFGTNYRLLKWLFSARPGIIVDLYNACLEHGFHPKCLRNALVVAIPKPHKIDMSAPKSYRPISLLETLSKCLEKIIAARISFEVGKHNLLPYTQFGGRDNSSCVDAGLSLSHDIHAAWAQGKFASLLTLDISGYFNNVNHARLSFTLRRLGFSDCMCNWLTSYFSDRTAQFRINDHVTNLFPISNVGIPQGSPLSPVLSSLYSIPVLLSVLDSPSLSVRAYVDDFTILATSNSHARNIHLLEEAAEEASSCLQALGLDFELEKCKLIHFAKSDHVKKCAIKGLSVISGLKLLANIVRGLSVAHARILFKACVLPILTYGSAIWYRGTRQNGLIKPLVKAQNVGLRWLLGAFQTSPIGALEHLASIPPMHITLARLSRNASSRLSTLPPRLEVAQRLPCNWDTHNPDRPDCLRSKTKTRVSPIVHLAGLSHPKCENIIPYLVPPWEAPHSWGNQLKSYPPPKLLSRDSRKEFAEKLRRRISALTTNKSIVCFTDGSKRVVNGFRQVGIGFTIQHHGVEIDHNSANLGPRFKVFDAEMLALALALKSAASQARRLNSHSIILFADNQAAVSLITSLDKHPGQFASIAFREAADKFLHEAPENRIKVCWVPGHNGIKGNKRADRLANKGGSKPPVSILNQLLTWSKAQSTHQASRAWGREWASQPHSLFVTNHIRRPPSLTLARFARSYRGHRLTHARLNQIILGHGFFGKYREQFRPDNDPSCPCGQPRQTLNHVLRDCHIHTEARNFLRRVSGPMLDSILFGTQAGLEALAQFLGASSAFTLNP